VVLGEPDRAQIIGDPVQPDRVRVVDQRSQQTLALGKVADLPGDLGVDAHVDELIQPAVRSDHTQRPVAGVHQLAGRLDDPVQNHCQVQFARDHPVRLQQPAQPAVGGAHVLGPVDQLREQLVELELGDVRCAGAGGIWRRLATRLVRSHGPHGNWARTARAT
jgi:hypothetical protein